MNINEFKSELGDGARANLYKVTLTFPAVAIAGADVSRKLSFLCKAAKIPSSEVGVIKPTFQGRTVPVPGDRQFEDTWEVTVYNDADFVLRNAFERWSNAISFHTQNTGVPVSEIYSDAVVTHLNRQGDEVKSYSVKGLFPATIAGIDLSSDASDAIEEFAVSLAFTYWESNTTA